MEKRTAVLLVNLGTPDSPSVGDVRKYLSQFLNDERVIDINWLARKILVNLIIVPFRAPKSAKIYKELWTPEGSPLLLHGISLKEKLQKVLPETYEVFLAMRYQNPSIESVLDNVLKKNFDRLIVLPLFPHYASSSSGSAVAEVMRVLSQKWVIPEVNIIGQFYDRPGYINTFVERAKVHHPESFDHILFSYHGLPVRQVDKVYEETPCSDHHCEDSIDRENVFCYKATCYETTRRIATALNIPKEKYTVAFQSRLDKNWLEPFSDKVVEELAKNGCKRLLCFSPAFVADCLETTIEIGHEYKEIFTSNGGQELQLVESLNDHPLWVNTIKEMILERTQAIQ
jgi:protoporphyrin/coproporphyrin ferrochelatase